MYLLLCHLISQCDVFDIFQISGKTPLMLAAEQNCIEIVNMLLEHNAAPNKTEVMKNIFS